MNKKVCIIGVNYSYNVLFNSLKILKQFKVLGVAGKKKREFSSSEKFIYYTSWKKMINDLKPDIVVVGTPPLEQEKILKFLLKKKINFMCEKPITNKLFNIKFFEKLSIDTNNKKIIDLNFLTIPAVIKFNSILKKIKITEKDKIEIDWFFKPKSSIIKTSWKNDKTKIGGELNNFLFHLLSVVSYFFGDFKISLIKKKNDFYIFLVNHNCGSFKINFSSNSMQNKFLVKVNKSKNIYYLINNSKDYHNNYYIYKNNKIIFRKNFPKNKSRIFASKEILRLFIKKNHELYKQTNFNAGLQIQKKIIDLKC